MPVCWCRPPSDTNKVNITQLQAMSNTFLSCGLSLSRTESASPPSVTIPRQSLFALRSLIFPEPSVPDPGVTAPSGSCVTGGIDIQPFGRLKKKKKRERHRHERWAMREALIGTGCAHLQVAFILNTSFSVKILPNHLKSYKNKNKRKKLN